MGLWGWAHKKARRSGGREDVMVGVTTDDAAGSKPVIEIYFDKDGWLRVRIIREDVEPDGQLPCPPISAQES